MKITHFKPNEFLLINFVLVIAFLPIYKTVTSQSDFKPGFIISHEMDTMNVLINNAGETDNCKKCVFKENEKGDKKTFGPGDIYGYRFLDGKYYISMEITIKEKTEKVFLEYLVDGMVDVFCYTHFNGTSYYIKKEGEELTELSQYEKTIYKDGTEYTIVNKPYVGHLNVLFIDAPETKKDIEKVSLNRNSLISISEKYHYEVCDDRGCVVYKKKLPKKLFSIGPALGYNTIHFENKQLNYRVYRFYEIEDVPKCFNFGLLAKISFPYTRDKLELYYLGLIYSYDVSSTFLKWKGNQSYPTQYIYSLSSTDLQHNLILRYNILIRKLKPFIELGGFYSQKLFLEKQGFEVVRTFSEVFPKQGYFGFSAGAGITYRYAKKMEVFIRFAYHKGWDAFSYYQTNEFSFTLGFPFIVN